jgi:hypothetical protein
MSNWVELIALLASFVATSYALVRLVLFQQKATVDRFVTYLEQALERQEEINSCFQPALEELTVCVRENSLLLGSIAERLSIGGSKEI